MKKSNFKTNGYRLISNLINKELIVNIQNDLLDIGGILDSKINFNNLDEMWNYHKLTNRNQAGAYSSDRDHSI